MLNSLDDPILSATFLNLVNKAYHPLDPEMSEIGRENMFMSPVLAAPLEQLAKFPPTTLVLAGIDPLRDDGLMMADCLVRAGVNVKVKEMAWMPHGFLNYELPMGLGMPEATKCIAQVT